MCVCEWVSEKYYQMLTDNNNNNNNNNIVFFGLEKKNKNRKKGRDEINQRPEKERHKRVKIIGQPVQSKIIQ